MITASVYGRTGGDPQERQTRNGQQMATVSLAVNVARPGANEVTVWFSLAAFGQEAETLLRHCKGDLLAALGTMTLNRYTDRNGQERESWSLTCDAIVSARTVRPSGGRKRSSGEQSGAARRGDHGYHAPFNDDISGLGGAS